MLTIFNRSSKSDDEQEQTITVPEYSGTNIMFHYHEKDRDLWYDLTPHINTLVLRLATQEWGWRYYYTDTSKLSAEEKETKHKAFVQDLKDTFLYIPCTSATFLTSHLISMEKHEDIKPLLEQAYMQPIPLRACHGTTQSILPKPLAAYSSGHERDEACTQVIAVLEQKLLSYQSLRGGEKREPLGLLEETKSPLLLASSTH